MQQHAFISYVREDAKEVDHLQRALEAAGIRIWRDTRDLWPGEDWRLKIQEAITNDSLVFIACFSHHSLARTKTYQNAEIALARQQMELRRPDQPWFLPVRLSDCEIPSLDLGGGRMLGDLQCVDLFSDHWDHGMERLVEGIRRVMVSLDVARARSAMEPEEDDEDDEPPLPPEPPSGPMRLADVFEDTPDDRVTSFDDRDWARVIALLRNGDCTPVIGAGVNGSFSPALLGPSWAENYGYPFGNDGSLPEVMQYASVIERDPVTVKQRVCRQLIDQGEPDFSDPAEPHTVLARFPIRTYLTTNYDGHMTRALQLQGKDPTTAICPWYEGAGHDRHTRLPPGLQPQIYEPLVYHLHGSFQAPESLVLAEQDYVNFLSNLAMDRGMDSHRMTPVQVTAALSQHPLLFIGYSLRDWSFRMLFEGLVRSVVDVHRRRHIGVQLAPIPNTRDRDARRRAEYYLAEYLQGLNISVYWGSAREFCAELVDRT